MRKRENRNGRERNHSSRSTHRHRRSRWRRRKKQILSTAAICICCVLAAAIFLLGEQREQREMQVSALNTHDTGSGYRDITYQGKHYRYNSLIKAVLYAGVDGTGKMEETLQYGNKARADVISLMVLDKKHKKMTILPINRDTMTEIRRYSMNGNDNGLYATHLGYAYSYGNGGKVSCENLCESVSRLLFGIPVREYVVTNQDSMPYINELVNGITLTVPNDDLEEKYPGMARGEQVTLDETNVVDFLQYRDTEKEFSNEGRMERQKAYVTAYIEKVREMGTGDIAKLWNSLETMDDFLQTNLTKNKYLDFSEQVKESEFSEESFRTIEGEDRMGELHDEFYPDEDALLNLIIELFYDEV